LPDPVGDFVYLRLQKGKDDIATGYPPKELDAWAKRAAVWARGGTPEDLPQVGNGKIARPPRATSSSTSSTRARCARRPRRWS
jgi:uncharacterized protein YecE (DUF72 family)